ncbi:MULTISPECIES: aspartyl protease family protein [unclassified Massilia]|uniref:aspartyl protease family protein n=1 Tax=unclassified Massilia TaxID=2609279 RepID=UPI001783DA32|nr:MULTISPECIES: aspartyl protease family protein [unclassified Massilia]MBD8530805.1 aspartyl protease family protein [Massilia sp. CFBP 13647]MBD8674504.1 aspartyl protease family protein [Massilia sp. CFBP 13721]
MKSTLLSAFAALVLCTAVAPTARAEAPACRYLQVGMLPLHYSGQELALSTEGSINGTPATMLVDTGAFDTLLTKTGAERRKLSMRATGHYAKGIGGDAAIYLARVDAFTAGPLQTGRGWMPMLADFGDPPAYDAIIGAPFLLQTDMELSLATKKMRFFQPSNCSGASLAYWDEAAMEIPFEANLDQSPNPQFSVLVNGKKMRAMIDTGAASTVIGLAAAQRAGLRLDAPDLTRLGDSIGIGARRVTHWSTSFATFQIGDEIVRNAQVGVIDWKGHVDILLGADFLRAHRVLIAMSQQKIYLSYVGGEPFGQRRKLEPWIVEEAEAGNHDAQMLAAYLATQGGAAPGDAARSSGWLEKATLGGNPSANLMTGHALVQQGFLEQGIVRLRHAADKLPSNRKAAMWLYLARIRNKQADLARTELAANLARSQNQAWPAPVADFFLGKMTAESLLKQAAAGDGERARKQTCEALSAMSDWHGAHGEAGPAAALSARFEAQCAPSHAPSQRALQ